MELFDHLITWWLSRPAAVVIGILVALEAWLAGILYFLVSGRWTRDFIQRWCRIDPMMIMPIALIFGLLVGFLGAEIRQCNQQAGKSVADEARALDTIHALTRTSHGRLADVRAAARSYATVVVEEEFPQFGNVGENPAAVAAVDELERLAAEYAVDRDNRLGENGFPKNDGRHMGDVHSRRRARAGTAGAPREPVQPTAEHLFRPA